MKRITIRLACASIAMALALSGCAGDGGNGGDRTGAFGTGYGSNGTRLFERDDVNRPKGARDAVDAGRANVPDKGRSGGRERSGMFGSEDKLNGSRDGGGAGWFGLGTFSGRKKDSDKSDATRSFRVGNGYDGITPDGAGTSDPEGAPVRAGAGDLSALRLGGVWIADGNAASASGAAGGKTGDGSRVLRVSSPVARRALGRLIRNLSSGHLSARADAIARDLRIVLKDAR